VPTNLLGDGTFPSGQVSQLHSPQIDASAAEEEGTWRSAVGPATEAMTTGDPIADPDIRAEAAEGEGRDEFLAFRGNAKLIHPSFRQRTNGLIVLEQARHDTTDVKKAVTTGP